MRVRGGTLAVVATTILAASGLVASSALGAAGEIAYRCNNNDICLLDPDAPGSIVNLSFNDASSAEGYPFWAPDGSRVGFVSTFPNPSGAENLFTMNPSAPGQSINGAVQLTTFGSGPTREAVWSPDGSKVAFVHGNGSNYGVYAVNADGSSATPKEIATVANGPSSTEGGPSFSPDGTKIAYAHANQIYIANSDGTGFAQPLAGAQGHSPQWSPDGTKIAFETPKPFSVIDVRIVNIDGSGTPVVLPTNSQFGFIRWSPDGRRIAYRDVSGSNGFYRVANADGTGVTSTPVVQNQNANAPASWSPDGSRLIFSAFYYGGAGQADDRTEVNLTNSNGTGSTTTLTTGGVSIPVNKGNADAIWKPSKVFTPPVQPPLPGPTIKPKLVWITKRIPYSEGPFVPGPIISCPSGSSDARCIAAAAANRGGGRTTGIRVSLRGKPKKVLVAKGTATIPAGQSKRLKFKLTKAGKKLLLKKGALKLNATVRITIPGQETTVSSHVMRVYVKRKRG